MSVHQPLQMSDASWLPMGRHRFRIDGDILFVEIAGALNLDEMKVLTEQSLHLGSQYGYVLVLINAARASVSTPEARKYQAETLRDQIFPSCTALYGASALARGLTTLVARAIELLTGKQMPSVFTSDEATAREVLARARLRFVGSAHAATKT